MTPVRYNYILFDWDGCIANTLDVWIKCIQQGFYNKNIIISREKIIKDAIINWENVKALGIEDTAIFGNEITIIFNEHLHTITLNPQAEELLKELKALDKKIALVTSSQKMVVHPILEKLNLNSFFDTVITSNDVTALKPDPEPIEKALKALEGVKEETIMFGDTRNDIMAGKNAGIATGLYFPVVHEEFYDRDYILGLNADYYIRNLDEVLEIVR